MAADDFDGSLPKSPAEKRLYYGCSELLPDGNTAEYRQCLAVSVDGRRWHKPNLALVAHNGTTANNIVAPCNNSNTGWVDVFRDERPGVPPAERWKALINEAGGDHIWVSADALHFTRHGNRSKPVLVARASRRSTLSTFCSSTGTCMRRTPSYVRRWPNRPQSSSS